MRLALIDDFAPAVIAGDNAYDLSDRLPEVMQLPGELRLRAIIEDWGTYHGRLHGLRDGRPVAQVRFRAPLPRPTKLLCAMLSFREGVAEALVLPPRFFLKASSSVIGPGDVVELPLVDAAVFHHEAELAVVIGKRAKGVTAEAALGHVFGYTCFMDISARGVGAGVGFEDKSYDTFAPMGPWVVTADEIPDPHALGVRLWVDGDLRQDYPMSDIANSIGAMIAAASSVAALEPGDVLAMGVNHQGLGPLQDGERVRMEIEPIGVLEVEVRDRLKRRWRKGIDQGTAQAVRRVVRGEPPGAVTYAERLDGAKG